MTAVAIPEPPRSVVSPVAGRFAGLGALIRKDATEWRRGKRAWVVAISVTLFMVLTAANGAITTFVRKAYPSPETEGLPWPDLDPLTNLAAGIASQIFLVAAVFAVASLIVHERETGTLAWVASKPVSRGSIWLSKWLSSTALLAIAAVVVPFAVTVATVIVLYGALPVTTIAMVVVGMIAATALFAAVGLAAGTVVPGQPGVVAIGLVVLYLVPVLAGLLPVHIEAYLPTSILGWSIAVASGADAGIATPIAWGIGLVVLITFSIRRMETQEL
jgi:ABC-2 type transport system permease protein